MTSKTFRGRPATSAVAKQVVRAAEMLRDACDHLRFAPPVTHVYNPLHYAGDLHRKYIERYARPSCRVIFLGMNPGPWGMAQTGVPFGEVAMVRNWLGLSGQVQRPHPEHPKRRVAGLDCPRSEVSGARLWGLFADRFEAADRFFEEHFVANYCPLVFMEQSARNRTPDKLPSGERNALVAVCDAHLMQVVSALRPEWVIGIGAYAEAAAERVIGSDSAISIGRILHPSPASPAANRGWGEQATRQLQTLGVWE